jgi:hypothetical protein
MRKRWIVAVVAAVCLVTEMVAAGPAAALPPSTGQVAQVTDEEIAAYLDTVYSDLFGRPVDPSGETTWTAALRSGTPRRAVADAITGSDEFRTGLITDAYTSFLGRMPDAAGTAYWLQRMREGLTIQQMEAGFLSSPEYWAAHGSIEILYVYGLYADVLGREPSQGDASFWARAISICGARPGWNPGWSCIPRESVALQFLLSTERLATDLEADYQWLLGRSLDPSGSATWVHQLQSGVRYETVVGSIIASDEYWNLANSPE